jgi:hypothetical protein
MAPELRTESEPNIFLRPLILRPLALHPEVSKHHADVFSLTNLLELFAGRTPITGQVVDGADRHLSLSLTFGFIDEMGARLSGRLEDHGLRVIRIERPVGKYRPRIDDEDIQIEATLAAALADHESSYRYMAVYVNYHLRFPVYI